MSKSAWVVIIVVLLVLLTWGLYYTFSSSTTTTDRGNSGGNQVTTPPVVPPASPRPTQGTSLQQHVINIASFAFSPATLTIKSGDSVTWTNNDAAPHTVTSDSGSELASGTLSRGGTYSHTFTQTGTYSYHCTIHPGMTATILVSA